MCHDSSILAASMSGLNIDSKVGSTSSLLYFFYYIIYKLFLQCSSSSTPLSYSWVFTKTNQLFSCNETYVCNSIDRLMMMTAHTFDLGSNNKHAFITVLAVIREASCFRSLLVPSSHNLLKIHFGQPFCSLLAIRISLSINQEAIKNFFEGCCCLKDELLFILFCDILRNIITSPKSFSLSFHSFSDDLRSCFVHFLFSFMKLIYTNSKSYRINKTIRKYVTTEI